MGERENPFGEDMEILDLQNQPEVVIEDPRAASINAFLNLFDRSIDWRTWEYKKPNEMSTEESTQRHFWQVFLRSNLFPQVIPNPNIYKDVNDNEDTDENA